MHNLVGSQQVGGDINATAAVAHNQSSTQLLLLDEQKQVLLFDLEFFLR